LDLPELSVQISVADIS